MSGQHIEPTPRHRQRRNLGETYSTSVPPHLGRSKARRLLRRVRPRHGLYTASLSWQRARDRHRRTSRIGLALRPDEENFAPDDDARLQPVLFTLPGIEFHHRFDPALFGATDRPFIWLDRNKARRSLRAPLPVRSARAASKLEMNLGWRPVMSPMFLPLTHPCEMECRRLSIMHGNSHCLQAASKLKVGRVRRGNPRPARAPKSRGSAASAPRSCP